MNHSPREHIPYLPSKHDIERSAKQLDEFESRIQLLGDEIESERSIDDLIAMMSDAEVTDIVDRACTVFDDIFYKFLGTGLSSESLKSIEEHVKDRTGYKIRFSTLPENKAGRLRLMRGLIELNYSLQITDLRQVLKDLYDGVIPEVLLTIAHEVVHFIQFDQKPFHKKIAAFQPAHERIADEAHAHIVEARLKGAPVMSLVKQGVYNSAIGMGARNSKFTQEEYKGAVGNICDIFWALVAVKIPVHELARLLIATKDEHNDHQLYLARLEDELRKRVRLTHDESLQYRNEDFEENEDLSLEAQLIGRLDHFEQLTAQLKVAKLQRGTRAAMRECVIRRSPALAFVFSETEPDDHF